MTPKDPGAVSTTPTCTPAPNAAQDAALDAALHTALGVIREDVRAMHAYAVHDASGLIKLDAMENPYGLPQSLRSAFAARVAQLPLNRYPGSVAERQMGHLHALLRSHAGLLPSQGLVLGNGSDELIGLLAQACARPGAKVLAPLPGFVMYAFYAKMAGLDFVGVPLRADFALDAPAMVAAVLAHRPALTWLAYPNNPTANLWDEAAMQAVVDAVAQVGGLVVIDEAYQPFASRSWLPKLPGQPHVLLMRTLSKFGLAGVRLGYLSGAAELMAQIDKVRPPYNVSVLNAEAACFALEHAEVFAAQAQTICEQRARLMQALRAKPQCQVFDSEANMILVRVPDARAVFEGLKSRGILIKNVSGQHDLLANCVRLTVGQPHENDALLAAMSELFPLV